jgi:hypothetical protein
MSLLCHRPGLALALTLSLTGATCARALGPADNSNKPVTPQVLHTPFGLTEVGLLDGAPYRIDIPSNWNHSVVVFYHGYALRPYAFHIADRLNGQEQPFLDRRFAVIQSAYSQTGWALQQAYPETEALRRYFIKQYGQPIDSYVAGASMGGELVSITLELNPKPYLGGLDLCGSVGPTYQSFEWRFAMRAAFDHYFPDVMPPLLAVPEDFADDQADRDKVAAALRTNPTAAALLRNLTSLHNDADLAHDIAYWTFVVGDMEHRAGGNPFDNRNFIYTGSSPNSTASDFELNDHVHRYTANPVAREYLMRHFTPSGHLGRPMLAVHTVYDPVVPAANIALYNHEVEAAGAADNLVQQFVDHEGHCAISSDEIGSAFDELLRWTHKGPRPTPGLLK